MTTLSLARLAASASAKSTRTYPINSQRANDRTQIAEASDGDGEMDDALEAELEKNARAIANVKLKIPMGAVKLTKTSNSIDYLLFIELTAKS